MFLGPGWFSSLSTDFLAAIWQCRPNSRSVLSTVGVEILASDVFIWALISIDVLFLKLVTPLNLAPVAEVIVLFSWGCPHIISFNVFATALEDIA